jgi:integrase
MLDSTAHHGPAGVGAPPDPDTGENNSDARFKQAAAAVRPRRGNLKAPRRPGERWGVEFSLRGQRHYVSFPESGDWDRTRAEREREYLMEKVNRGEWTPAPRVDEAPPALAGATRYADVAAEALARQVKRLDDPQGRRARDLAYEISIGLDVLGPLPVDQVDERAVEEMVDALIDQRLAIEAARERGTPLMETYVDARTGRKHRRRRRALSNSTINLAIGAHQRVLRYAHRQRLIDRLPGLSECRQRAQRPRRSYLQPAELAAVLEAADALDRRARGLDWDKVRHIRASPASAVALARELGVSDTLIGRVRRGLIWNGTPERPNRNDLARRAIVEALVLLGPRVAELCGLLGHDVDLARRRVRIRREITKTDAGERVIPMLPAVRERLIDHRARRPDGARDPIFPTRNARPNTPNNILHTVLQPVHAHANELLDARGLPPIAHLTPHTLRRTFASILGVCRVDTRRAVALMGHTDARMTLGVYAQLLKLGPGDVQALEDVIGCTRDEARALLEAEDPRAIEPPQFRTISERAPQPHPTFLAEDSS